MYRLDPRDYGVPPCEVQDLKGGDAATNAAILRDTFGGQRGAVADALCLNAGVALAACGVAQDAGAGIQLAQVRSTSPLRAPTKRQVLVSAQLGAAAISAVCWRLEAVQLDVTPAW